MWYVHEYVSDFHEVRVLCITRSFTNANVQAANGEQSQQLFEHGIAHRSASAAWFDPTAMITAETGPSKQRNSSGCRQSGKPYTCPTVRIIAHRLRHVHATATATDANVVFPRMFSRMYVHRIYTNHIYTRKRTYTHNKKMAVRPCARIAFAFAVVLQKHCVTIRVVGGPAGPPVCARTHFASARRISNTACSAPTRVVCVLDDARFGANENVPFGTVITAGGPL